MLSSFVFQESQRTLRAKTKPSTSVPVTPAIAAKSHETRGARLRASKVTSIDYCPKVVVTDIAMSNQLRIPFSKVNPLPVEKETTRRRNATRACRKTEINYSTTVTQPTAESSSAPRIRCPALNIPAPSSRKKRRMKGRVVPLEPTLCSFCEKSFSLPEFAQVSKINYI